MTPDFEYNNVYLFLGCYACPEQYDARDSQGNYIGYLRLRHGRFTVEYPDVGGKLVYSASPAGDGIFDDAEREYYLQEACTAISRELENGKMEF